MTSGAVTLWLADHPRIRRAVVAMTLSYTLSLLALLCAPQAVASGVGGAGLDWSARHRRGTHRVLLPVAGLGTRSGHQQRPGDLRVRSDVVGTMDGRSDGARGRQRYSCLVARNVLRAFIFVIAVRAMAPAIRTVDGMAVGDRHVGATPVQRGQRVVNMMLAAIAITICAIIGRIPRAARGARSRVAMVGTAIILTVLLATVFTHRLRIFIAMTACLRWGAAQVWRLRRAPPVHLLPRARLWMPSSTPCCPTSSPQAFDIRCRSLTSGWSSMISADAVKPGAAR